MLTMFLPNHKQCFDRSLGFDLQEGFSTDDFILVAGNRKASFAPCISSSTKPSVKLVSHENLFKTNTA